MPIGSPPPEGEKIGVCEAVEWLKKQRDWLLQMQQMYGIDATALGKWLDLFVNECACRGKQEHESLADVMQHFNDWLKIKVGPKKRTARKERHSEPSKEPPDWRKRWTRCLAELCQSVSAEEAGQTFEQMRYENYDPDANILLIQVPTKDVYERLERYCVPAMKKFITKYFGNARLKYRIIESK